MLKFDDIPPEQPRIDSKHFVKLGDGGKERGVFRGNIHSYKRHWYKGQAPIVCTGAKCDECAKGDKPGFRFRINFITKVGDQYVAKIFEQGITVLRTLKDLQSTGYDLEKHQVQISRTGTSMEATTYTILPVPNGNISPETEKIISNLKLHDLVNPDNEKLEEREEHNDIPF